MNDHTHKFHYPKTLETRIVRFSASSNWGSKNSILILHNTLRKLFNIESTQKFYLAYSDNSSSNIAIKTNADLIQILSLGPRFQDCLFTIMVENNEEKQNTEEKAKQSFEEDSAPSITGSDVPSISESLQSIMKHLEQGVSTLQASVEKSATITVDTVAKVAAETAAHVYRSMLPPAALSDKPQFDVICDGCYTPIRGQRWRCETCDDFDLCSTCKSRVNHNPEHNFRYNDPTPSVYIPEELFVGKSSGVSEQSMPSQTVYICDYCDSDIVGIRHTCGACPDFDLCHSCFAIVKENHPDHIFVTRLVGAQAGKKAQNQKEKPRTVFDTTSHEHISTNISHHGVFCDHCQNEITGIRYKCGHCGDYDLCDVCEELALEIHNKEHAFIKIRYPIQSLSKKPILPKFLPLSSPVLQEAKATQPLQEMEDHANSSVDSKSDITEVVLPSITKEIATQPAEIKEDGQLSARFLSDLNIPDGAMVVPNKIFMKMWKIENNGSIDWPVGTHLLFNGGSILRPYPVTQSNSFIVPVTSPNDYACISAELQAPDCPGEYSSYFCLCTPEGVRFGDSLWCTIKVDMDEEPEKEKYEISAADILMNSSNTMIYPTVSTAASSIDMEQQEPLTPNTPNRDEFTDHDDYSEFTTDHASTTTSEMATTHSHVSSPASSELDIGETNRDLYFTSEGELEDPFGDPSYPEENTFTSASLSSTSKLFEDVTIKEEAEDVEKEDIKEEKEMDEEEDFILVDEQEEDHVIVDENEVEDGSLSSSTHTITLRPQSIHHEEFQYRDELLQLHEMGFTSYDDLAISLLNLHKGNVQDVLQKLLCYP